MKIKKIFSKKKSEENLKKETNFDVNLDAKIS
jgi:hypothetical protein